MQSAILWIGFACLCASSTLGKLTAGRRGTPVPQWECETSVCITSSCQPRAEWCWTTSIETGWTIGNRTCVLPPEALTQSIGNERINGDIVAFAGRSRAGFRCQSRLAVGELLSERFLLSKRLRGHMTWRPEGSTVNSQFSISL